VSFLFSRNFVEGNLMLTRFLVFVVLGAAGMFLAEWVFPHSVDMAQLGILTWIFLGLTSGILIGFWIRHVVSRDNGDGNAIDLLGACIGFSIGFPLYHVLMNATPILHGIVSVFIEGGFCLYFYERAVRKRRASVREA
jgi:uncharacterized membrane protein YeaQ/YmgE (transglycosylase-associated protein family)